MRSLNSDLQQFSTLVNVLAVPSRILSLAARYADAPANRNVQDMNGVHAAATAATAAGSPSSKQ